VCVRACRKLDCFHIPEIALLRIEKIYVPQITILWETNSSFCITCRTRHCIHSRCCLIFLARLCVLCEYRILSWVTWRTFYSDAGPQIIQSFGYTRQKFYLVSPLVIPGNAGYLSYHHIKLILFHTIGWHNMDRSTHSSAVYCWHLVVLSEVTKIFICFSTKTKDTPTNIPNSRQTNYACLD